MHVILPQSAIFVSAWLIVFTSIERLIAVLYPFHIKLIITRKRCYITIASMAVFFVTISTSISCCLTYDVKQPQFCQIKGNINGTYSLYYRVVFQLIRLSFGSWVPSVLNIILNVITIRALLKAMRIRKWISVKQNKHDFTNANNVTTQPNRIVNDLYEENQDINKEYV